MTTTRNWATPGVTSRVEMTTMSAMNQYMSLQLLQVPTDTSTEDEVVVVNTTQSTVISDNTRGVEELGGAIETLVKWKLG